MIDVISTFFGSLLKLVTEGLTGLVDAIKDALTNK